VAQKNFGAAQTGFRLYRIFGISTIFPQLLTESGPKFGKKTDMWPRDQLELATPDSNNIQSRQILNSKLW
jgi:hypothetical protein